MLSVQDSQPGVSSPCVMVAEFDAAKVLDYMERIDCAEAEITRDSAGPPLMIEDYQLDRWRHMATAGRSRPLSEISTAHFGV